MRSKVVYYAAFQRRSFPVWGYYSLRMSFVLAENGVNDFIYTAAERVSAQRWLSADLRSLSMLVTVVCIVWLYRSVTSFD